MLAYGVVGWTVDSLFVSTRSRRLGASSPLNIPVYALALPLFEPVHDRVRGRSLVVRGALYGVGILAVEYASGRFLRRVLGRAPWNYEAAGFTVSGLIRPDYAPLWAAYGLGLERLHDVLVRRVESI